MTPPPLDPPLIDMCLLSVIILHAPSINMCLSSVLIISEPSIDMAIILCFKYVHGFSLHNYVLIE